MFFFSSRHTTNTTNTTNKTNTHHKKKKRKRKIYVPNSQRKGLFCASFCLLLFFFLFLPSKIRNENKQKKIERWRKIINLKDVTIERVQNIFNIIEKNKWKIYIFFKISMHTSRWFFSCSLLVCIHGEHVYIKDACTFLFSC